MERDILFLACTRPAMKWGVPMEGWYANLFGTVFFAMFMGSPVWWLVGPLVHFPMRALANRNPGFFHEWRVWFGTKAANAGASLWTLPPGHARRAAQMPSSV